MEVMEVMEETVVLKGGQIQDLHRPPIMIEIHPINIMKMLKRMTEVRCPHHPQVNLLERFLHKIKLLPQTHQVKQLSMRSKQRKMCLKPKARMSKNLLLSTWGKARNFLVLVLMLPQNWLLQHLPKFQAQHKKTSKFLLLNICTKARILPILLKRFPQNKVLPHLLKPITSLKQVSKILL